MSFSSYHRFALLYFLFCNHSHALDWDGSVDSKWSTREGDADGNAFSNWVGNGVPESTDSVRFNNIASTARRTIDLEADRQVANVTFDASGTGYVLGAVVGDEKLSFTGQVSCLQGNHTINADVGFLGSGASGWAITGGTLSVAGAITGPNSLSKTGGGTLSLSGSNRYSGNTLISAGSLLLGGNEVIPNSSAVTLNGTLDLAGYTETIHSFSGTGLLQLSRGSLTILNSCSFDGQMNVGGTANSSIMIPSGVTYIHNNVGGSGSNDIANLNPDTISLTFDIETGGSAHIEVPINTGQGTGTLIKKGGGTLSLSNGSNGYRGGTVVEAGTLVIENSHGSATGSVTGSGAVSVAAGATIQGGGTISGDLTLQGTYISEIDGASVDVLAVGGTLNPLGATLQIDAVNIDLNNEVVIATFGTLVAPFSQIIAPDGVEVSYNTVSGTISVSLTSDAPEAYYLGNASDFGSLEPNTGDVLTWTGDAEAALDSASVEATIIGYNAFSLLSEALDTVPESGLLNVSDGFLSGSDLVLDGEVILVHGLVDAEVTGISGGGIVVVRDSESSDSETGRTLIVGSSGISSSSEFVNLGIGGGLDLNGELVCEVGPDGNDYLDVTQELDLTDASLSLSVTGALTEEVIPLIVYGTKVGGFTQVTGVPNGYVLDTNYHGRYVVLIRASRYYVDWNASGGGTGLSWENAFTTLQDALGVADSLDEIWVRSGTYYPDEGGNSVADSSDATFTLKDGVALYGGFSGNESLLSQRDILANVTILSGDIQQDDVGGVIVGSNAAVVTSTPGSHPQTRLDGFTITNGSSQGGITKSAIVNIEAKFFQQNVNDIWPTESGIRRNLGISIADYFNDDVYSTVILSNDYDSATGVNTIVFQVKKGGFIHWSSTNDELGEESGTYSRSSFEETALIERMPRAFIFQSLIMRNLRLSIETSNTLPFDLVRLELNRKLSLELTKAQQPTQGGGADVMLASPIFQNCHFSNHVANGQGGALRLETSFSSMKDCVVENSISLSEFYTIGDSSVSPASGEVVNGGGGIGIISSSVSFDGVIFDGNESVLSGGALSVRGSECHLTNCVFTGNSSGTHGGAIYVGPTVFTYDFTLPSLVIESSISLTNCLFAGNSAAGFGGSLCLLDGGTVEVGEDAVRLSEGVLMNCAFSGNKSQEQGGMLYSTLGNLNLTNSSVVGNYAEDSGGAIVSTSEFSLSNSILWGNSNGTSSNTTSLVTPSVDVSHCLIEGFSVDDLDALAGNLSGADLGNLDGTDLMNTPSFADAPSSTSAPTSSGDLRLLLGSSGVDAGESSLNGTAFDLAGNTRVLNGVIDLGAYETPVFPAAYLDWAGVYYPDESDAQVLAYDATPGSGVISNLMAFVTGNDPFDPLPIGTVSFGDEQVLYTFQINRNADEFSPDIEFSFDLVEWFPISGIVPPVVSVNRSAVSSEGLQDITVIADSGNAEQFFVRVTSSLP